MTTGCSAPGTTYEPESGKRMSVQRSHSATLPVISSACGATLRISAPIRACTRIQRSNGRPSSFSQWA